MTNSNTYLQDAAENSLSYQAAAKKREEELLKQIEDQTLRLHQVEARCVELLQLKIGQEKDIRRLRNEITTLTEAELDAREKCSEQEKIALLATRKADLTMKQVHEEMLETLASNKTRHEDILAREKESREEEVQQLNEKIAEKQKAIGEAEQRLLQQQKEYEEAMRKMRVQLQSEFGKSLSESLQKQRLELEASAEKMRSDLEMRMVRLKEKALADQTAVYKRELAAGEAGFLKEKKALEEKLTQEKRALEEKLTQEKRALEERSTQEKKALEERLAREKTTSLQTAEQERREQEQRAREETERLQMRLASEEEARRRVTSDLRAAIDAKDALIARLEQEKQTLSVSAAAQETELQSLRRAVLALRQNAQNGDPDASALDELVEREQEKQTRLADALQVAQRRAEEAEERAKRLDEELQVEKREREDEAKRWDSSTA